jgi:EpsI family protein
MTQPLRVVVSVVCLVAALLVLQSRSQGEAVPLRRGLESFPSPLGRWLGREATLLEADILNILKVDDYLIRRYVDPAGRSLSLYIGYWQTQRKGAQMHSPKNCLPGSGWEPLEASTIAIPLEGGRQLTVNRFVVQKDNQRQVVLYWYRAQGHDVASEVAAKMSMVQSAITRNRTDGAVLRVSSLVEGSVAQTSEQLVEYVRTIYPLLADYLPN